MLENAVAVVLLLVGLACFGLFLEKIRGNSCQNKCCNKGPKVIVVSEGPGERALSQILENPPKLKLED